MTEEPSGDDPDGRTGSDPDGRTGSDPDGRTGSDPDGPSGSDPDGPSGSDPDDSTGSDTDTQAEIDPDGSSTDAPETLADAVEAALRDVRDPNAGLSVFEAGLVENIHVVDGRVTIEADVTDFPPRDAELVTETMVRAVGDVDGVEAAHVEHVRPEPELSDRTVGVGAADKIVAVASAKGGVGKSTVATMLACALAADGKQVGLFDADVYGPNVPELLSVSGPVHSDDDGNPIPVDANGLEVMSVGLLSSEAPLAWRGAMAHDALSELFEETAWSDPDTLVVDLPPGTGDVALTTLQDVPIDGVVFVTTPFHAAVSDTHRSLQLFEENEVPVLGVVSNMGEFVCEECGTTHDLFDGPDPIEALDAPRLAEVPFTAEMQDTLAPADAGLPDPARELATNVERRLEEVWTVDVPEDAVDIRGLSPEERHERVRERFAALDPGEDLFLVSDRDPTPVRNYLLDLAGEDATEIRPFEVKRQNPETWFLRTARPE
ncbi:P-loop NTPase [Halobellus marinus]|uniref:P-loop NTPase n=1 Tax=Halobellus TaxID=1073986 RepID=UPI0028AFA0B8|nr:P-loop NTPase [Halobellus sp. DFY28]